MSSFLDLFPAKDSDGAPAGTYQLHYLGSAMSNHDSWIFGMATAVVYALFKIVAVAANGLLGLVLSSASWLDPLSEFYRKITEPLYSVVPPWAIACMGLGIVAYSALQSRPAATTGGLFNSETLDRLGIALALVVAVVVLTHDPFMLVTKTMELANGFSVSIAAAATGSGYDTTLATGQAMVDNSIRTPTLALNYGAVFDANCRTAWSMAMVAGQELPSTSGCFAEGQNRAGADTLFTAFLMLVFPALPMLVFAIVAAWKYVLHLSMSVLALVSTAWVAALAVPRRRGFESLANQFALAAAHLVMAVLTSMAAVGLPALVSGFAINVLGMLNVEDAALQAYALMIGLGVGFAVAAWAIVRITANSGALVRLLRADANITLEKTLGITPAASMTAVFKQFKTWEWARAEQAKVDAARPAAPPSSPRQKGHDTVPETVSAADAAAVVALTAPAMSVTDAAAAAPANPTIVGVNGVTRLTAPAEGQESATAADQKADRGASDRYGYFVTTPGSGAADAPAEDRAADGGTGATDRDAARGDNESAKDAAARPIDGNGSGPATAAASDGGVGSALAPATVAPLGSRTAPTPVPGNEFADPALDAVARSMGATFVATGQPPASARDFRSVLRRFRSGEPLDPVPFGFPSVEHGEALVITDRGTVTAAEASSAPAVVSVEAATDQARWNRLWRGRAGRPPEPTPVTSSETSAPGRVQQPSIRPGVNRNPASFIAPPADFLASAALEADMDTVSATLAAAGTPVRLTLPADDNRLALRLSSDPEQRVVRASGQGFGDPL